MRGNWEKLRIFWGNFGGFELVYYWFCGKFGQLLWQEDISKVIIAKFLLKLRKKLNSNKLLFSNSNHCPLPQENSLNS